MSKTFDLTTTIEAALLQAATRQIVEEEIQRLTTAADIPMPDSATIDKSYAEIIERWITDADKNPDETFAYQIRLRKHLYQRSYNLNDFKTCLSIAESLAKLIAKHEDQARKAKDAQSFSNQFAVPPGPKLKSFPGGKK